MRVRARTPLGGAQRSLIGTSGHDGAALGHGIEPARSEHSQPTTSTPSTARETPRTWIPFFYHNTAKRLFYGRESSLVARFEGTRQENISAGPSPAHVVVGGSESPS